MKKLKIFIALAIIAISGNVNAQKTQAAPTLPLEQINQVQSQLVDGMVSFVESVRPFYAKGDTYQQFKVKVLIGNQTVAIRTALPVLPKEGEAMLQKAYEYLSKGLTAKGIAAKDNGKTIGEATLFMYNYQKGNSRSSIDADVALFGGNQTALDNNPLTRASRKRCKWWQIRCHLQNIFGDDVGDQITDALGELIKNILKEIK